MSITERLEKFIFSLEDKETAKYIKESELFNVVVRGLLELYKAEPKIPITFLASWLLHEGQTKEIKRKVSNKYLSLY